MKTETRKCIECGEDFDITEGWYELIKANPEIQLPKRCHMCRRKKRERNREFKRTNK